MKEITQLDQSRTKWETEYKVKSREFDTQHRDHRAKLTKVEHEKRRLIENAQYLAERLETERLRADAAEKVKVNALAQCESMRKNFGFYRDFYDTQAGVFNQYFNVDKSPTTTPRSKGKEVGSVAECKQMDTRDSAVSKSS